MEDNIFDITRIESPMRSTTIRFIMGIDNCDENNLAYCLMRITDEVTEPILSKVMSDPIKFNEEVENLGTYFEAEIIKEKH